MNTDEGSNKSIKLFKALPFTCQINNLGNMLHFKNKNNNNIILLKRTPTIIVGLTYLSVKVLATAYLNLSVTRDTQC